MIITPKALQEVAQREGLTHLLTILIPDHLAHDAMAAGQDFCAMGHDLFKDKILSFWKRGALKNESVSPSYIRFLEVAPIRDSRNGIPVHTITHLNSEFRLHLHILIKPPPAKYMEAFVKFLAKIASKFELAHSKAAGVRPRHGGKWTPGQVLASKNGCPVNLVKLDGRPNIYAYLANEVPRTLVLMESYRRLNSKNRQAPRPVFASRNITLQEVINDNLTTVVHSDTNQPNCTLRKVSSP